MASGYVGEPEGFREAAEPILVRDPNLDLFPGLKADAGYVYYEKTGKR